MTEDKINKRYYMPQRHHDYIQEIQSSRQMGFPSNALQVILDEHKEMSNKMFDLRFIVNQLKNEVLCGMEETIKNTVTKELQRIRLGTNNADRNTQILIELLQAQMILDNVDEITTTNEFKPEFLQNAETVVHERILNLAQRKHSANNKSQN